MRSEHTRPRRPACIALLAGLLLPALAQSQPVRGIGDDALTAPRGSIRVQFGTGIADWDSRYGAGTPGRRNGSAEPLGIDFNTDTLGVAQFPVLGAAQAAIRSLTGNSSFTLNLGRTYLGAAVRTQVTPLMLEAGLTNRLQLSVMVPIVTARTEANLNINGSGSLANVSYNPARQGDTATNLALVTQLTAARNELATLITACTSNAGANAACPAVLASGATVAARATSFLTGITQLYGTTRSGGAVFVPLAGTAADSIIRATVSTLRTQLASFGVTPIAAGIAGPARPTAAVTPDGLKRAVRDTVLGLAAVPPGVVTRQGLGDMEVALKLRLFDSFGARSDTMRFLPVGLNVRQSIAGVARLGTGTIDSPDDYVDVGTGDGQHALELRSFTDLVYGRRFFGSIVARYTIPFADQIERRVTLTPAQVWATAASEQLVNRTLGRQLQVELTPRVLISDVFSIGVQYLFRHKAEDAFTRASGTTGGLDPSTLALETNAIEHRLGWGVTYSSLARYDRGRARLPVEVTYFNQRSMAGSGGLVPKLSIHQVQMRWYPRR